MDQRRHPCPKKANSWQIDALSDFFIEKVPPLASGTVQYIVSRTLVQQSTAVQCQNIAYTLKVYYGAVQGQYTYGRNMG